jgi:hypothetical protein
LRVEVNEENPIDMRELFLAFGALFYPKQILSHFKRPDDI